MNTKKMTLQAHIEDFWPDMDQSLSEAGIPVSERPMKAARFFVDHLILEVAGDTKEDYQGKPWFAAIFMPVQDCYKRRYGEAQLHPNVSLAGVVEHYGALYLLRIPLVVTRPVGDGTCWLTFAKDVLPGEEPTLWIVNGPSIEHIRPKPLAKLKEKASGTTARLRGIANDLKTADLPEGSARSMAISVLRHLDKAASDICALDREATSLAMWELNLACEKCMKAYLTQEGITYPMTHDLRALNKLAPTKHDWSEVKGALAAFPSEARIMKWRYQQITSPTMNELWRFYQVAMQICSIYAGRMSRTYVLDNFALHLSRPPWLGQG